MSRQATYLVYKQQSRPRMSAWLLPRERIREHLLPAAMMPILLPHEELCWMDTST